MSGGRGGGEVGALLQGRSVYHAGYFTINTYYYADGCSASGYRAFDYNR